MAKILYQAVIERNKSRSNPSVSYEMQINLDDEDHLYLSCNCPAWTRGASQKGKQAWERNCRHTDLTSVAFFSTNRLRQLFCLPSDYVFPVSIWLNDVASKKATEPKPTQNAVKVKTRTRFNAIELDD